jgi:hypothetical protein
MTELFNGTRPNGAHFTQALSASVFTLTVQPGSAAVLVQAVGNSARITLDGTDPTASSGFMLRAGDQPTLIAVTGHILKFIQAGVGAAIEYQFIG